MYNIGNVKTLSNLNERAAELGLPLSTIVAELMHLAALDAVFSLLESEKVCFQGGTSIHLLHGGYRFSEDLDFAGSEVDRDLSRKIVEKSRSSLEKTMIQLLGLGESEWRFPRRTSHPRVFTCWYLFRPQGYRRKFRLKMEFGHYPIYETRVYPVRSEMDFINRRTLVTGLTPKELLAEKVNAFIGRPYFKARDLFDIWYLKEILKAPLDPELMARKLRDYGVRPHRETVENKLRKISPELMANEMNRFLPRTHRRRLEVEGYKEIRESGLEVVGQVLGSLSLPGSEREP